MNCCFKSSNIPKTNDLYMEKKKKKNETLNTLNVCL